MCDMIQSTIYRHKHYPSCTFELIEQTNKGWKGLQKDIKSLSKKERNEGKVVFYSDLELKQLFEKI
jgi:hypothetical protein